ncbi:hypothetical protein MATL_G00168480 [Megalops atlanticus]|uniref:Uncharacterized protein n=1 Tax=Megalops atlanticus TaxID=7932 RepID=A0A9D3PNC6_MEGAT|nr:hypothetical protein MATL_G00168480 [Megalops atlanticus]
MEDSPTAGKRKKPLEPSTNMNPNQLPNKIVLASPDGPQKEISTLGPNSESPPPGESRSPLDSRIMTIRDLKQCGELENKGIQGKVVLKSPEIPYTNSLRKNNVMFHLVLADETGCIKVIVYGKKKYKEFKVGRFYLLWGLIFEDKAVKVTSRCTIGLCGPLNVPHEVEEEAELLFAPPVSSIREAKDCDPGSLLTIQGTVIWDRGMEKIPVDEEGKTKKKKIEKRVLSLEDETGSIDVQLWGNVAKSSVKVRDCVKITNVKVNVYFSNISLKSTRRTALKTVTTAAQETTVLTIQAIEKSTKKQVNLMAVTSGGQQTFTVATTCLTKFFEVPYDNSFKENLLKKIPTTVEAVVHGSEILSIKK